MLNGWAQAPRAAAKGLLSAEGRAAALAAALREREACLASAQAQLLQTEARHAEARCPYPDADADLDLATDKRARQVHTIKISSSPLDCIDNLQAKDATLVMRDCRHIYVQNRI